MTAVEQSTSVTSPVACHCNTSPEHSVIKFGVSQLNSVSYSKCVLQISTYIRKDKKKNK